MRRRMLFVVGLILLGLIGVVAEWRNELIQNIRLNVGLTRDWARDGLPHRCLHCLLRLENKVPDEPGLVTLFRRTEWKSVVNTSYHSGPNHPWTEGYCTGGRYVLVFLNAFKSWEDSSANVGAAKWCASDRLAHRFLFIDIAQNILNTIRHTEMDCSVQCWRMSGIVEHYSDRCVSPVTVAVEWGDDLQLGKVKPRSLLGLQSGVSFVQRSPLEESEHTRGSEQQYCPNSSFIVLAIAGVLSAAIGSGLIYKGTLIDGALGALIVGISMPFFVFVFFALATEMKAYLKANEYHCHYGDSTNAINYGVRWRNDHGSSTQGG
jgi:hypothetical protein